MDVSNSMNLIENITKEPVCNPKVLTINGKFLDDSASLDVAELFPPEVLGAKNQINVKSWTCKHCFKVEKSIAGYAKHLKLHYKVKRVAEVSDSNNKIECDICCKKFGHSFSLYRHLQGHTGEFTCSLCLTIYSRKSDLVKHQQLCKDGDGTVLQCVICKLILETRHELREHLIKNHSSQPNNEIGTEIFSNRMQNDNQTIFPCAYCGKSYSRRFLLTNHVKIKHNIYGKNADKECLVCDIKFNSARTALRHRQIHNKGKMYKCTECEKSFLSESMLKHHKTKHENGSYSCPYCDSVVRYVSSLKRHINIVHKNKLHELSLLNLEEYKNTLPLKRHKSIKNSVFCSNLKPIQSKDMLSATSQTADENDDQRIEPNVLQISDDNFIYENLFSLEIDYPIDIFCTDDMTQFSNEFLNTEPKTAECDFYVDTDTGQLISLGKEL